MLLPDIIVVSAERRDQVTFSMALANAELVQEYLACGTRARVFCMWNSCTSVLHVELVHQCFACGTRARVFCMWNSCTSILHVELVQAGTNEISYDSLIIALGLIIAWGLFPPTSLRPEAVDALPNEPNLHL